MSIRAITFDFWFTLFREANGKPRQRTRAEALSRATGVPVEQAEPVLNEIAAHFRWYHLEHQKTLGPRDAVAMVAERFGLTFDSITADDLANAFAEAVLPYPPEPIEGALDAVRAAAARLPVGIISDTGMSPGRYLRRLLDRFGFTPYISASVFSDEVGVAKPQGLTFETCARALGVQPSELLHIGDTEQTDIIGARGLGSRAVLFAEGKFSAETAADYVLTSWREFPYLLEQLQDEMVLPS